VQFYIVELQAILCVSLAWLSSDLDQGIASYTGDGEDFNQI